MKTLDYKELLNERLQAAKYAASYLTEVLANDDYSTFLIAVRDVIDARTEGISSLAIQIGVTKEALLKAISVDGNLGLLTLNEVLKVLGLKISFTSSEADKNTT